MEQHLIAKEKKIKTIQRQILDGRKVQLISNEKLTSLVRLRYNNTDTDGTKKWRILIYEEEYYTSEIIISCPTRTLTEKFEGIGEKHHVVCDAIGIIFENNVATIY